MIVAFKVTWASYDDSEIEISFCKYAVPRIQGFIAGLSENKEYRKIGSPCRYTDMIIFHSLKTFEQKQIMPTLIWLAKIKCITFKSKSLYEWCFQFSSRVIQESVDYFKCTKEQLHLIRYDVLKNYIKKEIVE